MIEEIRGGIPDPNGYTRPCDCERVSFERLERSKNSSAASGLFAAEAGTVESMSEMAVTAAGPQNFTIIDEGPEPVCGGVLAPYPAGDSSQNCRVDFLDFSIGAQDFPAGFDMVALKELAENWLICSGPVAA